MLKQTAAASRRCRIPGRQGRRPPSRAVGGRKYPSAGWRGGDEMIARSQHEGVLTLRLAHGKASALDVELLDALARELDGAAEDVRALVLTGTGSIFSAGVDLFRLTQGGADYV